MTDNTSQAEYCHSGLSGIYMSSRVEVSKKIERSWTSPSTASSGQSSCQDDKISAWRNKKIAILGLGIEGFTTAQYLLGQGLNIVVLDKKEKNEFSDEGHKQLDQLEQAGAKFILGPRNLDGLLSFDIIFRSPGFQVLHDKLTEARDKSILVTSQIKLFFDLCPCPIIGVTGTKGKGTTSSLITEMLKKDKRDAYLGGNIGQPPITFLDKLTPQSVVVLELSSFQLQDLKKSPHIAVLLMITSEHLDYHKDTYEYIDAKRNILRYQNENDFAVINRDYPASNESDIETNGKVFYVSRERNTKNGCFVRDNSVWVKINGSEEVIVDIKDILLPGKHNLENVCSAVMAAVLAGVSRQAIVNVLTTFKGLEHRLELIADINGVKYYDDSFSTTPETAIAAIEAFESPEIIILGGSSKGSDFTELGNVISSARNIKAIIGIGLEWSKIRLKIKDLRFKIIENCKNMEEIVRAAKEIAVPGDVVLLSPACASFDMFKNYKDRGEQFRREVKK